MTRVKRRKLRVGLLPNGRIIRASCQCGKRHARIANGGWKVPWWLSAEVVVDRSKAREWILECGCMRLSTLEEITR